MHEHIDAMFAEQERRSKTAEAKTFQQVWNLTDEYLTLVGQTLKEIIEKKLTPTIISGNERYWYEHGFQIIIMDFQLVINPIVDKKQGAERPADILKELAVCDEPDEVRKYIIDKFSKYNPKVAVNFDEDIRKCYLSIFFNKPNAKTTP